MFPKLFALNLSLLQPHCMMVHNNDFPKETVLYSDSKCFPIAQTSFNVICNILWECNSLILIENSLSYLISFQLDFYLLSIWSTVVEIQFKKMNSQSRKQPDNDLCVTTAPASLLVYIFPYNKVF